MSENLAVVIPVFNEPSIGRTLKSLYNQEHTEQVHHIVVDNGSTDETQARIAEFTRQHEDFPLSVIEEPEKGTGAASDTGFRFAADKGYGIIARTDADTIPRTDWTMRIDRHFASFPDSQLVGGKIEALRDHDYRIGDDLLMSMGVKAMRAMFVLQHAGDVSYSRIANGANMATRAMGYEEVGGFSRSSIDMVNEDIDYSIDIVRAFGKSAAHVDTEMVVSTSMRRIRHYGRLGTIAYYLFPERRSASDRIVDVR